MKKITVIDCGGCPHKKEYKHKDKSAIDICTKYRLVIEDIDEIHSECTLVEVE